MDRKCCLNGNKMDKCHFLLLWVYREVMQFITPHPLYKSKRSPSGTYTWPHFIKILLISVDIQDLWCYIIFIQRKMFVFCSLILFIFLAVLYWLTSILWIPHTIIVSSPTVVDSIVNSIINTNISFLNIFILSIYERKLIKYG